MTVLTLFRPISLPWFRRKADRISTPAADSEQDEGLAGNMS